MAITEAKLTIEKADGNLHGLWIRDGLGIGSTGFVFMASNDKKFITSIKTFVQKKFSNADMRKCIDMWFKDPLRYPGLVQRTMKQYGWKY